MHRKEWIAPLVLSALAALSIVGTSSWAEAATARPPLLLPIPQGETWYVCQGYHGEITHGGVLGLDLSIARKSVGRSGCLSATRYSSAGAVVSSPGTGIAHRWPGCCGDDFVCVELDRGGSIAIGHLSDRVATATRVAAGQRIGTVAWPASSNGDYSHIHVQAHSGPDCTKGSGPVAFDVAHGFRWACTPDLPYSGSVNQYSGLALTRCRDDAAPRARPDTNRSIASIDWLLLPI